MSTMDELFAQLNQERAIFLNALQGLPDALLDQKGVVGEWSIKNVLAHLTDWEDERLASGSTPRILLAINADEDAWNTQQVASREHLTPNEQLDEFQQTRQALLQVLRDMGEEALNRQHPWPEWKGTVATYILDGIGEHEHEHREAVLAALASRKSDSSS